MYSDHDCVISLCTLQCYSNNAKQFKHTSVNSGRLSLVSNMKMVMVICVLRGDGEPVSAASTTTYMETGVNNEPYNPNQSSHNVASNCIKVVYAFCTLGIANQKKRILYYWGLSIAMVDMSTIAVCT